MKTEAETLFAALERLEDKGIISELEDDGGEISYFAPDRLGYYPTFKYDKNGNLTHAGVTI
jgi:Fe2+ or Zn2+ uptake regulation protein